ncbi:RNase H domain-containing protein [Aphis craccivora]|uniref:RNase H domain-containing protein n=1 Tax=Aphis craccivora TaxID=307492 RepID=A0A6G0W043_APHCR|nr:RNase H domain-containing protein [Aphis craccivora]
MKLYNNYYKIKLLWIPGHFNIIENERADQAAKTTISSTLSSSTNIILYRDMQALITNKYHLIWHQKWLSLSTKLNQIKHNTDNWTFPIKTPKQFEVIITKLRIGHSQISHNFLMAKEEPPTCALCGV